MSFIISVVEGTTLFNWMCSETSKDALVHSGERDIHQILGSKTRISVI